MKILWLTNTPCGSVRKYNNKTIAGGWLVSLEDQLKRLHDLQLFVAYISPHKFNPPFSFEGVNYYPIHIPQNREKRFLYRIIRRQDLSIKHNDRLYLHKISEIISEIKPDLIHVHGTENCFGLIQKQTKIPTVISIQGLLLPYTEKYFSGIALADAQKQESLTRIMRRVTHYDNFLFFKTTSKREKQILSEAQYIIGRTEWDKNITGLFNPKRKYFQGEELLRNDFYNIEWKKKNSNDTYIITTTMSNSLYKGYETLLKAAIHLTQAGFKFEWNVIGVDKNSELVQTTEKLLHKDSTNYHINLLGRKSANEIITHLLESDLYCQVSHIENSPNSLCEAMLIGMPCIATNAGGTPSLLKDHEEGIIIQDGDSYSLAGNIITIAANEEKAILYGKKARERGMYRHNKQRVTQQYYNIYKTIIQNDAINP